jgi:hypothetical protein
MISDRWFITQSEWKERALIGEIFLQRERDSQPLNDEPSAIHPSS